jgi:phosphoribosylformylglycinamidine synthase
LSEGGLAAAAAEMAFAGGLGAKIDVREMSEESASVVAKLFSESNTRFLCEVEPQHGARFEEALNGLVFAKIGQVAGDARLVIRDGDAALVDADIFELKEAWQAALRF